MIKLYKMDSDDDFDEILPEARIFDNRVDDIWNEKMEAYDLLLNKNRKEVEDSRLVETVPSLSSTSPAEEITIIGNKRRKKCSLSEDESPTKVPRRTSPRKKYNARSNKKDSKSPIVVSVESLNKILEENENSLSAVAKRRLRRLQLETNRENQRVQKETEQFLSSFKSTNGDESNDIHLIDEEEIELKIQIKIRFNSEIHRITVGEKEVFESIFKKVADQFQMKPMEILLCLGDKNISLTDTPKSLNLKIFHIIDCIPYKHEEQTVKDSKKLTLTVQSNDSRKKTELQIHALEKFEVLMEEYSKLKNIPLKDLAFEFDGERIQGSETPADLEMESGSCIDVRVLNYKEPVLKKISVSQNFEPVPPNEILEIYDIE